MRLSKFFILYLFLFCESNFAQSLDRLWTASYNGQGDFSDRYTASVTDADGNLIVAGSTAMPDQNRNLLVRKLSSAGNVLWTQIYNGPGDGADEALALVTDAGNNIYVTGFQKGSGAGNDFITLKYAPDSTLLWTAIYNYSSNQYDQSNSIALGNGFVVVTGQSDNDPTSGSNDDYVTIKYNVSDGTPIWTQRYNGLGNAEDRPVKVLADAAGNVFVTGTSDNGANFDFVTLKYSSVGELLWLQYGDRGDTDRATDMTADVSGNIYITGRSQNTAGNYDYYTLKYNTAGSLIWSNVYDYVEDDRPNRLAFDPSGNVLVTGKSDQNFTAVTNYDIATIKINNANGAQLWAQRFNGSANDTDEGLAIWADASDNVYVAGETDTDADLLIDNYNWVWVKYNASGSQVSSQNIDIGSNKHDVFYNLVAYSNQLYLCGYSQTETNNRNAIAMKVNTDGTFFWTNTIDGPGDNSDNVRAVAANTNDAFYTAGYTVSFYQDRNMCISKRNTANGNLQWLYQLNGTSPGSSDEAVAIATDNNGNVVAAGYTKNSGTSSDFTTIKLNADGDSLWVQQYNGPASESDRAADLAIDASGNIYVCGRTDVDASVLANDNYIAIKYNASGAEQWVRTYGGAAGGEDRAVKIKVSNTGIVYVVGREWNGADFDITIVTYSASGVPGWTYTYPDAGGDELPTDATIDATGNLYITATATALYNRALTFALNPSGSLLWSRESGATGFDHSSQAITLNSYQQVLVAANGYILSGGTTQNSAFALLYNDNGELLDTLAGTINHMLPDAIVADDIVAAPNGFVCLAAHADEVNTALSDYNWYIYLFSPNWTAAAYDIWEGSNHTTDVPNALLLLNNVLIAAGSSVDIDGQRNMQFIAYDASITGIANNLQQPEWSVYPNPATDYIVVDKLINTPVYDANTVCTIYNLMGQKMPVEFVSMPQANRLTLHVANLTNGIYVLEYNGNKAIFTIAK